MSEEKLKVYQVCTPDGTIHEVHALYGFNNADKNNGSLIFRAPSGSTEKTAVVAEFNFGHWSWWRIKPARVEPSSKLDVDTELGIGSEHLPYDPGLGYRDSYPD